MNQINLRRFIYTLYHSKTYDLSLLKRVEKELNNNLNNNYLIENIMNYLMRMLLIKSNSSDFDAININKINEMLNICINTLIKEEINNYLIKIIKFSKNLLPPKNEIIRKLLISLFSQILLKNEENIKINSSPLFSIMQYLPHNFITLFNNLKYKLNKLTIEKINLNSYKLHINYLCFLINTTIIELNDLKKYINPLYNSYEIISKEIKIEKEINVLDLNFNKLKIRKELIKQSLNILFKQLIKSKNLKTFYILNKYKKFYFFISKESLIKVLLNIESLKKIDKNVIKVYEEILFIYYSSNSNNKVKEKIFNFLNKIKPTDFILECLFINKNNQNIEFLFIKLFQLIKKKVSFNLNDYNILIIFLSSFNKLIITDLNRIYLTNKIFNNNKKHRLFINDLINHRSILLEELLISNSENNIVTSLVITNRIIETNEYLKNMILNLIYNYEVENIIEEINITLNSNLILKLNPLNNKYNLLIIENFLQTLIEIIKQYIKINKIKHIYLNKDIFKYKHLWENKTIRLLLLFIYKLFNKTNEIEKYLLTLLLKEENILELQILGNKEIINSIINLYETNKNILLLKNNKQIKVSNKLFEKFFINFLFFDIKSSEIEFFKKYLINKKKKYSICLKKEILKKTNLMFLLKFNKYLISPFINKIILLFPNEEYNNLILQLKLENLIIFKDLILFIEKNNLNISLFKNTLQSFEIFFDEKLIYFEFKKFKKNKKFNLFLLKFNQLVFENFNVDYFIINSLKNILIENDVISFLDVLNHISNFNIFFGSPIFFFFFILSFFKFKHLFNFNDVLISCFLSCEYLNIDIEDYFLLFFILLLYTIYTTYTLLYYYILYYIIIYYILLILY